MAKNQSLPARLQEKDSRGENDLTIYEHHENPPSGDWGLVFQTHALQMILFGPFYVRTQHCYGSLQNRVLTIGAVCGKGLCVGIGGRSREFLCHF